MTKAERAIKALRECADALDALTFRRQGLVGVLLPTRILRDEANWIENAVKLVEESNEEV